MIKNAFTRYLERTGRLLPPDAKPPAMESYRYTTEPYSELRAAQILLGSALSENRVPHLYTDGEVMYYLKRERPSRTNGLLGELLGPERTSGYERALSSQSLAERYRGAQADHVPPSTFAGVSRAYEEHGLRQRVRRNRVVLQEILDSLKQDNGEPAAYANNLEARLAKYGYSR